MIPNSEMKMVGLEESRASAHRARKVTKAAELVDVVQQVAEISELVAAVPPVVKILAPEPAARQAAEIFEAEDLVLWLIPLVEETMVVARLVVVAAIEFVAVVRQVSTMVELAVVVLAVLAMAMLEDPHSVCGLEEAVLLGALIKSAVVGYLPVLALFEALPTTAELQDLTGH